MGPEPMGVPHPIARCARACAAHRPLHIATHDGLDGLLGLGSVSAASTASDVGAFPLSPHRKIEENGR